MNFDASVPHKPNDKKNVLLWESNVRVRVPKYIPIFQVFFFNTHGLYTYAYNNVREHNVQSFQTILMAMRKKIKDYDTICCNKD